MDDEERNGVMRRKDKEITEFEKIVEIAEKCDCITLGINDGKVPYVVPVSFGTEVENGKLVLYFHGAMQGKKYELLEKNPDVFVTGNFCAGYRETERGGISCKYESFMAQGTVERIFDEKAQRALDLLTEHCGFAARPCPDKVLPITAVYRLVCENLTGKKD